MVSVDISDPDIIRRPTEYLLGDDVGQLSPMMVYRITAEGFELNDVQKMLSISHLYSTRGILRHIVGKSIKRYQGRNAGNSSVRLDSHQSAIAFQYAKILELAINTFGTQTLAEEWLGRPCKYLDCEIPLDVIGNSVGFQAVEQYLDRIQYGIYQ